MENRDSFIFYRSFFEAISDLEDYQQLEIYKAIAEYSLNFKESDLKGVSSTIFKLIKPNLEANNKRFLNGSKPKQKQTISKTEANNKQNGSEIEAKQKQVQSKTEANKDKDKDKDVEYNNMLENEFQALWKNYTLTFLKKQGRSGGTKTKAETRYKTLRRKYQSNEILNFIENHKKQKLGHKDLERLLVDDLIKQYSEDIKVESSNKFDFSNFAGF